MSLELFEVNAIEDYILKIELEIALFFKLKHFNDIALTKILLQSVVLY